jgi:2-polyprenyl-3-methyl-5-hydroxy-6-metoxy-1,4-benzoquinol methylase
MNSADPSPSTSAAPADHARPSGQVWHRYWDAFDHRGQYYREPKKRLTCDYSAPVDPFDREIFSWIQARGRVLDVGAGNNVTAAKMARLGYTGRYDTLDVAGAEHTYRSLDEVQTQYDAILLLEVIEHLSVAERTRYLERFVGELLAENGVIIIATPNANHINAFTRECWTHCQAVPMRDLYCFFRALGFETHMWLVKIYTPPKGAPWRRLKERLRYAVNRILCYFLYVDPEERILFVARKPVA